MTRPRTTGPLMADIATRIAAMDFTVIGQLLPNPDPLLKELGRDLRVYRDLLRDSHVGACVRRRRAALKAMKWGLTPGQAPKRVQANVTGMLADLDVQRIIAQAAEACLYGYQPMELSWRAGASGLWLSDLQAKPPEWFCYDPAAQLRFKTKAHPLEGEALPLNKFVVARQDADYRNPYGQPDLALCYWPVLFKKGGMRFWLTFAEKFGGAFAVGKLPRTATDGERNQLLGALEDLVQDAVAVIPDDGSAELIEAAGKSASADLYERLVMYCRGEISIVLTGTNQTVEASANRASAHAGMVVADTLRDGDAAVVCAAINQALRHVGTLNWPGQPMPVFEMWDQAARDALQAQRDQSNAGAGAKFTPAYWKRAYGYQDGDLVGESPGAGFVASDAAPQFAESVAAAASHDPAHADLPALASAAAPVWQAWVAHLAQRVDRAESLQALQADLVEAYGQLDSAELERLMAAALALAELRGMAELEAEITPSAGGKDA